MKSYAFYWTKMTFRISPTAIQKKNFKKVHECSNYMIEEG